MSWLDNIISFISPEKGVRREAYRQQLNEIRSYDAGNNSRLNHNWRITNQPAEITNSYSRNTIRARARDLECNSDMMNAIISAYIRNVIGGGYNLQVKIEGEKELNKQIEKLWKTWCKKNNCDVTATQSFEQIIRMAIKRKKIDGGILFLKRYTKDGLVPFKLQIIEVDELCESQTEPHERGNKISGGIEYNKFNKPVGYWIKQYAIDGYSIVEPEYVKAKDVIFYFTKSRPTQLREISDITPSITRIRDINEYMTAVSTKERVLACLSVFIKKAIPTNTSGRPTTINKDGRIGYEGKMLAPGMINELNVGDEVQIVNPTGNAANASDFIKINQRLVGAGQGISYEAFSRDMSGSTYSSARQGMIEDGETYNEEIELLQEVMSEIYETFIISCVLSGLIKIPDFWNDKEKYFNHMWIHAPKKWIDPLKEANANKIALQTGQKSFKQICSENGLDWQEQIDEIKEVKEYAQNLSVDIEKYIFNSGKNATTEKIAVEEAKSINGRKN